MPFPAHPGDTAGVILSPLERLPMLGPPPLAHLHCGESFQALGGGGGLVVSRACTGVKCGTLAVKCGTLAGLLSCLAQWR